MTTTLFENMQPGKFSLLFPIQEIQYPYLISFFVVTITYTPNEFRLTLKLPRPLSQPPDMLLSIHALAYFIRV